MLPQEIIRRKRDGEALSAAEIESFIAGLTSGAVTEGQAAAFAMAVFFKGMSLDERVALTRAMMRSGSVIDWREARLPGPILDKHSTGGIGDNVSLMLAPMLAACGAFTPMISGRGLGHTGGTLDKLDSIPGYVAQPDLALFRRTVAEAGCAIIGQTADLAPADKRLYAIRDVTATVESIALITASILSKKLAAGLQGLVMDVKTGSGAFMASLEGARELAQSLASVATGAGLPTTSLITDMNEPLASAAGNAVEVQNAVDYLTGEKRDARLHAVTIALGGELLALGGLAPSPVEGRAAMERSLASGAAAERFERMVAMLGGPHDFLRNAAEISARRAGRRRGSAAARGLRRGDRRARRRHGGRRARRRAQPRRRPDRSRRRLHEARRPRRARFPLRRRSRSSTPATPAQAKPRRNSSPPPIASAMRRRRGMIRSSSVSPGRRDHPPRHQRLGPGALACALARAGAGARNRHARDASRSRRHSLRPELAPFGGRSRRSAEPQDDLFAGRRRRSYDSPTRDLPDVPIVRVVDADLRDRMSEWVVLHALIHLRQQRMYDWQQDQQIWGEDVELPAAAEVRVGVLGLGLLGADAAQKLATIGFDVAGWSRTPRGIDGIACFHGEDGLDALLARTDILVALLPLTPQTRGILNARLFASLAPDGRLGGPILLNAGRGGLQVEADILTALDEGVLKAATLDVFESEPLPKDSPLWRHPRVTISPHNAAISTPDAVLRGILGQIEAFERGEALKNVVDRTRGY